MTPDRNGGRPLPWHDTPSCQEIERDGSRCNGPMVPADSMPNGHGGGPDARIACAACGHGVRGTQAEVWRVRRADAAFDLLTLGLVHLDRGCERCNGVLMLDRTRLCANCVEKDNAERQGVLL